MGRPKESKNKINTKIKLQCYVCGKIVYLPKCRVKGFKYCSKRCMGYGTLDKAQAGGLGGTGRIPWNKKYKDQQERQRERQKRLMKNNVYKINQNFSNYIRQGLNRKQPIHKIREILGYTKKELYDHLESLFTMGMTWENHSRYGWHIDHIKPISSFSYESIYDKEFKECWALKNLRPLWWEDNLRKGNKIIDR